MSLIRLFAVAIAALLTLHAAAAYAQREARTHPELVCDGHLFEATIYGKKASNLHAVIRSNGEAFCIGTECVPLTRTADTKLEYHCRGQAAGTDCESFPVISSAGPFILQEDLVVDLATGRFERTSSGSYGDRATGPYSATAEGACVVAKR